MGSGWTSAAGASPTRSSPGHPPRISPPASRRVSRLGQSANVLDGGSPPLLRQPVKDDDTTEATVEQVDGSQSDRGWSKLGVNTILAVRALGDTGSFRGFL
ncbi:unnamed protein product [Symbiodinium sp. CCMP2592]|nr:unnamed protein product [Symbiodinium sp. CCMP2592]